MAEYQQRNTGRNDSQFDFLRQLELPHAAFREIADCCQLKGIEFLATPFDDDSLQFLSTDLGLKEIKIASGEVTNGSLLLNAASTGKPVILSTGMSTLGEVEMALGVLAFGYLGCKEHPSLEGFHAALRSAQGQNQLHAKVTLLHCTTEYPAPFADVNLRAMDTLAAAFGLSVGISDHTPGLAVSIAAAARGRP